MSLAALLCPAAAAVQCCCGQPFRGCEEVDGVMPLLAGRRSSSTASCAARAATRRRVAYSASAGERRGAPMRFDRSSRQATCRSDGTVVPVKEMRATIHASVCHCTHRRAQEEAAGGAELSLQRAHRNCRAARARPVHHGSRGGGFHASGSNNTQGRRRNRCCSAAIVRLCVPRQRCQSLAGIGGAGEVCGGRARSRAP